MQVISLKKASKPAPQASLVKRCALGLFRTVRVVTEHGQGLPAKLTQSAADIREAWQETARPNV